jgi:hypothetical protein
MAIGAQRDHVLWMIRPAITEPVQVMNLQKWSPPLIHEWGIFTTALADSISTSKGKSSNDL